MHHVLTADSTVENKAGPYVDAAVRFLESIGLPCRCEPGAAGFLPGLDIRDGVLVYDPQVPVSNLLHEAGHLALLPGKYRRHAQTDVSGVVRKMFRELEPALMEDPDGPLTRAVLQASDPEATAWAWAAGVYLGIPPQEVVRDEEYDGEGAGIRIGLKSGRYIGIHGLQHAGFCVTRPDLERAYGRPAYPKLAMWVQKDVAELAPAPSPAPAPRRRLRA